MRSELDAPHFHDEEAARAFVEAHLWPDGPVCPFCGEYKRIGELKGKTTRAGLRKCYACKKPFTVKIGTVFQESNAPFRYWLQAIYLMCSCKKGISTRQLQRTLGCGMKTAWHLGHRIRKMMESDIDIISPLGGADVVLEADETFVGRRPGTKVRKGSSAHMNAVFSLVERGGAARSFHVPNIRANTLRSVMEIHASRASHLMTDEAHVYTGIGWNFASHATVNHSRDEYVRGTAYTNTVEGFFSILKRGVYGVYQHISEAHLHRFLAEFDFRYSNREKLGINDAERAARALRGAKGKRLTYGSTR
ncbi:MAG TPA: IS1595 family transposase [Acidobacteriaceae bacterium]|nr:IS1595 family transposase [Acidobacteriaceae bacterium]